MPCVDQLAYISTAAPRLSVDDLRRILVASRPNNPKRHITGQPQCCGGHFFQILEGPAAALDNLLSRLRHDPRHSDRRLLFRIDPKGREFAD